MVEMFSSRSAPVLHAALVREAPTDIVESVPFRGVVGRRVTREEVVEAATAVDRCTRTHAAGIPADHVESVQDVVREEAARRPGQVDARHAGTAGVHEQRADPRLRITRRARETGARSMVSPLTGASTSVPTSGTESTPHSPSGSPPSHDDHSIGTATGETGAIVVVVDPIVPHVPVTLPLVPPDDAQETRDPLATNTPANTIATATRGRRRVEARPIPHVGTRSDPARGRLGAHGTTLLASLLFEDGGRPVRFRR